MELYYYNLLNKAQQNTYQAIKTGLTSLAPSFQIPRLEGKELADIYFMIGQIRYDYFKLCDKQLLKVSFLNWI